MSKSRSSLSEYLIVFLAYYLTAEISARFISIPSIEPLIWPASGIALAGVLILGPRVWPSIALGTLLLAFPFSSAAHFFATLAAAFGNVIEPLLAAMIFRRLHFSKGFLNSRSILIFFVTLAWITAIGASINAAVFKLLYVPPEFGVGSLVDAKSAWVKWWLGDLLGYIIVTPTILSWANWRSTMWPRFSKLNFATFIVTFIAVCWILFFDWQSDVAKYLGLYVLFPLLVWATVRYGRIGATTTIFLVSHAGVTAILLDKGPFTGSSIAQNLIRLHAFMLAYAFTGLTLAAFLAELRAAQATIRKRQESLEELVNRRTRDLQMANDELKRNKYFLDQAQQIAKIGSFRYNPNMDLDQWSNELFTIFEFPKEKFRSNVEDFYALIQEPYRSEFKKTFKEAIEKKKNYTLEYWITTPNGNEKLIEEKGMPLLNRDGSVREVIGTVQDVTEMKRIEEQLQSAKRAAEEASRAKTNFLAHMSHEIRTPLGIILGFTDLLSDPDLSAQERANYLSTIQKNGRLLASLINQVLDVTKIETGTVETEIVEVHTLDLLRDIKHLMAPKANESGLTLKFSFRSPLPTVIRTDPTALRQIFVNVIGNAIKFTPGGRIEVRTRLVKREDQNLLVFDIADTGVGLSIEQRERLFKPFSQADPYTTRKYGGTGLGLYLSQRFAQALGGDLKILASRPGKGSIFRLTIDPGPLEGRTFVTYTDLDEAEATAAAPASVRLTRDKRLFGKRVLLVEDSEDNQRLVTKFLNKEGAAVDTASNGALGYEAALKKKYDVSLMDIQMPIMDGYEATRRLRETGYTDPIIALTAHAMLEEKERCLRSGFSDYLSKPIDRNALVESILHAKENSVAVFAPLN